MLNDSAHGRAVGTHPRCGLGKPETFNFLGFTFICGRSRRGRFALKRKSRGDRMRATLQEIKKEMQRRMHQPIPEQGKWLRQGVTGFFAYHAVPTNSRALHTFRHRVTDLWRRSLRRRLSSASPYPSSLASRTLCRQTSKVGAECLNWALSDLCGGRSVMSVPTAIFLARLSSARYWLKR